jgi:thiol-disulfide isomerase/thioredoxin
MRRTIRWLGIALVPVLLATGALAVAETRTWTDSTGKHKIEAELLSTKGGKVRLRRDDGKEITIALDRLSEEDQAFVKEQANSEPAVVSDEARQVVIDIADKFYRDLRTQDRSEASALLTDTAQELAKTGKSLLAGLPSPDDNARSIKPGKAKIEGTQAEVPVIVRAGGTAQKTMLHLRYEADQWRVFAISAMLADGEVTINFESEPPAPGEEEDTLESLVGKEMELQGFGIDGTPLDMSYFQGKVVLIDFWATWCGPCRAEIPNILANWQQYHDAGFEVIAISVDRDLKELRSFVAQENPPWTVVADHHPLNRNQMGDKYRISGIPAFVLLGKDGRVAAVNCRGPGLGRELGKLLGEPKQAPAE